VSTARLGSRFAPPLPLPRQDRYAANGKIGSDIIILFAHPSLLALHTLNIPAIYTRVPPSHKTATHSFDSSILWFDLVGRGPVFGPHVLALFETTLVARTLFIIATREDLPSPNTLGQD
jgi:hypothetical protein